MDVQKTLRNVPFWVFSVIGVGLLAFSVYVLINSSRVFAYISQHPEYSDDVFVAWFGLVAGICSLVFAISEVEWKQS